MRTTGYFRIEIEHLLSALTPENRLACEISMTTGLRISDVLALKSSILSTDGRVSIREQKTGKRKAFRLTAEQMLRCRLFAGKVYIFENRLSANRHRTRQAVYKDLRRVRDVMRIKSVLAPHSLRKTFAIEMFEKYGSTKKVQRLLNHSNEAVTMLYIMGDELLRRKYGGVSK